MPTPLIHSPVLRDSQEGQNQGPGPSGPHAICGEVLGSSREVGMGPWGLSRVLRRQRACQSFILFRLVLCVGKDKTKRWCLQGDMLL